MKRIAAFILSVGLVFSPAIWAAEQSEVEPHIQAAIDNSQRPEADRGRDAGRKPGEVLSFVGLRPGMTVLDVFSGGGYYSEILSHLLGPDGQVIAHYNEAYQIFSGKEFEARYAGDRLNNVWTYNSEANEIDLDEGSVDVAVFILGFHDIYYKPKDGNWPSIDAKLFMENVYRALAPAGTFVVVDHAAIDGSTSETGNTVHRIDQEIVMSILTEVGFEYVGSSDALRHPEDDRTLLVFAPFLRGKTDRFILKFRKPEGGKE